MTSSTKDVLVRFAPMIYGPTMLFALGEGAVIPLIPVIAARLGGDLAISAVVAAALVVGQLCGNFPAGWLVVRLGERLTMAVAGTIALGGAAGVAYAPNLALLGFSVFLIGMCAAAFGLARLAFMTTRVPISFRARALALLGGSFRLGMFLGPFVAALLLSLTNSESSAAWFFAACLVACVLLVILGPDPEQAAQAADALAANRSHDIPDTGEPVTGTIVLPNLLRTAAVGEQPDAHPHDPLATQSSAKQSTGIWRTMIEFRAVLLRLGVAAASLSAVRSARQVVLPLWGISLGLDAGTIALIVGIAGSIDFALFYASGQVMDKYGRVWAVLPAMLLMGGGFIALAFTHEANNAVLWFGMLAAIIGVGNGLSSGVLMTFGADVAPQHDPAPFLSSWRTLTDAGGASAPLLFAGIAAVSTLGVATASVGVIGLLGAIGFLRWVPKYVGRPAETQ